MPSLADRFSQAWRTFQNPNGLRPLSGEVAIADPNRWYTTPYNPSLLVTRQGMMVFDKMRTDDQVKAALAFKQHAVIASGWTVRSPKGQTDLWEPTEFVKHNLKNLSETFEDDMLEILSALTYGFSITEKIWGRIQRGEYAGSVGLLALKTRKPHRFEFDTDPYGNLKPDGVWQYQSIFGQNPAKLPPEKFLIYTHDKEFSNLYGRSDLEAAYPPWWIKDNVRKWHAMYLERYAVPEFYFKYDPTRLSPAQIDELKSIAQNRQAATSGILPMPPGATPAIDIYTSPVTGRTQSEYVPALDYLDRAIAKGILMPSQMGLSPEGHTGSYARARVHFDVFILAIEKIRRELEALIQEQVVRPLVDQNYSVDEYPQWQFQPITEEDTQLLLASWLAAVKEGVVRPQTSDEIHVREVLKFPEMENPDEPPPAAGIPQTTTMPGNGTTPAGGDAVPGLPRSPGFSVHRHTSYDRRVNYARIENGLAMTEAQASDQLKPLFRAVLDKLLSTVEKNFPRDKTLVNDLALRGFGDIQDALREFVRRAFGLGEDTARSELPRTFAASPGFVPTEALRWLAQKSLTISGVLSDRLLGQAKLVLSNALKFGEPQADTLRKLKDIFQPYIGDQTLIQDGEVVDPFRLETILRTNATEAFNQGRLVTARNPAIADLLRGMEYSAVIDSRTTEVCRFLDGKVIPIDEPELDRLSPPNHFNCRSVLVPVTLDMTVNATDMITPSQIGTAEELTPFGFK